MPVPERASRAGAMSGGDDLLAMGDGALASLVRGEAEVVISDTKSELTRFAGNQIHQSVAERFRHVRVRLIDGGRTGVGVRCGIPAVACTSGNADTVRITPVNW